MKISLRKCVKTAVRRKGGVLYYENLRDELSEAFNEKKVWKFSNFSTADASLVSSHCLQPDLDAPGCCLFSDDLILIVLIRTFY